VLLTADGRAVMKGERAARILLPHASGETRNRETTAATKVRGPVPVNDHDATTPRRPAPVTDDEVLDPAAQVVFDALRRYPFVTLPS
jgi:hypothetical protein